ncbi:hypothetical protein ABG768_011375 [Culter alburnus]|uniref:Uncharacterized protein n=1 Tax=Culter alburnus TaxID=194366 RepID=A0AAW1Z6Y0_CULAL
MACFIKADHLTDTSPKAMAKMVIKDKLLPPTEIYVGREADAISAKTAPDFPRSGIKGICHHWALPAAKVAFREPSLAITVCPGPRSKRPLTGWDPPEEADHHAATPHSNRE